MESTNVEELCLNGAVVHNFSENESQTDSRDSSYNTDTSSESNSVNSDIIKNNKNNIECSANRPHNNQPLQKRFNEKI